MTTGLTHPEELYQQVDRESTPILGGENPFKLAVFGTNLNGGNSITLADGTIQCEWEETKRIAMAAERAGIEALIPVARWKGYGGATDYNARSFETFTWAAGLAAVTSRIQIFATFHVPTAHPVRGAKEVVTVDHISGGRMGLNLVAGWNDPEIRMFAARQRDHDERYEVADEWITLAKRLWTEEEEFDFDGRYFQVPAAISKPQPIQKPYPVVMSAGASEAGRRFAAKHADINFLNLPVIDDAAREKVASVKAHAREEYGKELNVMAMGHIVCRDTEQEAREYFDHYVFEKGDWEVASRIVGNLVGQSESQDDFESREIAIALIAGQTAKPLVGTPEQVVEGMLEMAEAGLDGMSVSWVDYEEGIDQFEEQIQPLMAEAGLRRPLD